MLNFVLCDDNASIMEKLAKMLTAIFIEHSIDASVVYTSTSAEDILSYTSKNEVNVLILDIDLNLDISGIDLARKVREKNKDVYIIFSTGHLEYMLVAYKVKTFDYLPKPITIERLKDTILRLVSDTQSSPKKYIKFDNKITINKDSIYYIQKDGMKMLIHTKNKIYETYNSFNKILFCLPVNFVRCHRSYIVNVDKISDIQNCSTILLENKQTCFIGPKYKNKFLEVLNHGNSTKYLDSINN